MKMHSSGTIQRWTAFLPLVVVLFLTRTTAAESVTFNVDAGGTPIVHGQIIDDEFAGAPFHLTVSAVNQSSGPNIAVAFDSTLSGTADPDLEGPPWVGGNIDTNAVLGNVLIIQENPSSGSPDPDGDGVINFPPDDEGSRPAGILTFDFSGGAPLDSFGMTLVDIEGDTATPSELSGYFAAFYSGGSQVGGNVEFADFITPGNTFYDPTVTFGGNNTANILQPVTLAKLASAFPGSTINPFDTVKIFFNGSGALGEINYSAVPEPSSFALLGIGAVGLLCRYRRRRLSLPING